MNHLGALVLTMVSISAVAMNDIKIETLAGSIMLAELHKNDWEELEDQTAIKLRALTKPLYTAIHDHREKKIVACEHWIQKMATGLHGDDYKYTFPPTLIIEKGKGVTAKLIHDGHCFKEGIKKATLDDSCNHLLPDSIIIGPSGNTLCGIVESKTQANVLQFGPRVRFKLSADGAICVSSMNIIEDPCFLQTTKIGHNLSYICRSFNAKTSWRVIEIHAMSNGICNEYRVTIGNTGPRSFCYSHNLPYEVSRWPAISFVKNTASQHYYRDQIIAAPLYLEYRFEKGGVQNSCYEHRVALNTDRSISLWRLPETLWHYLIQCPVINDKPGDSSIEPQPRCLTHMFVPNDEWPAGVARYIKHLIHVEYAQRDEGNWWEDERRCLQEYALLDLARLYQIKALCVCICNSQLNRLLIAHSIRRRSVTADIYCDVFGKPYILDIDLQPKLLDSNRRHIGSGVFERWARCLVPIGPLPMKKDTCQCDLIPTLSANRHEALQVSASTFLNFFIRQAEEYAEKTWDNGDLGCLWAFDDAGMRVHLYDLKAANNNHIGSYLILQRREGYITDVAYAPNQQPVFYIDGEKIEL